MYVGVTGYMYKWKYLKSMSIFISPVSHFLINTDTFQTADWPSCSKHKSNTTQK